MYLSVITPHMSDQGKWFTILVSGIVFIMTWVLIYVENQHIKKQNDWTLKINAIQLVTGIVQKVAHCHPATYPS